MRLRQLRVVCAFACNCNYLRHDDGKQQQHANMPSSYQIFESNAKNYFHLKHSLPHFILFTSLAVWSPDCLFVCTLACWFLHLVVVLCASLLFWFLCVFFFLHFSVLLMWRLLALSVAVGHMLLTGSPFCHYSSVFLLCYLLAVVVFVVAVACVHNKLLYLWLSVRLARRHKLAAAARTAGQQRQRRRRRRRHANKWVDYRSWSKRLRLNERPIACNRQI